MSVNNRHRNSLQLQLSALYLLLVAAIFILAGLFYFVESQRIQSDMAATDLSLAQAIALETEAIFHRTRGAVVQFAQMPAVIDVDTEKLAFFFEASYKARQDINLLYRLSKGGVMLYQYPSLETSTVGQDFSFREYFIRVQQTQGYVLSKGRVSPTTGRPVVTSVMPVFKDSEFDGVVAVNLELQYLIETVRQIAHERDSQERIQLIIVDSTGQIIAHSQNEHLLQNIAITLPEIKPHLTSREAGSTIAIDAQDRTWLYSYAPMINTGWFVIVKHPTDLAFMSLERFRQGLLLALLIFSLGASGFWIFLSQKVIQPLERLTRYGETISQQITGRNLAPETIAPLAKRHDPIGHLAKALLEAERQIQRRLMELTTLNKTGAAVISTLDTQQVIDTILNELQLLLNVKQCALLTLDEANDQLKIQAYRGLSEQYVEHISTIGTNQQWPAYRAIVSQEPIQVPDVELEPDFEGVRFLAKVEGYRSLLILPLVAPHVSPSALAIYRPDAYQFTQQEVDLAASFANHAVIALEHATLFSLTDAELQQQVNFLSALNRVGHTVSQSLVVDDVISNALDVVFEMMPADACWICLQREGESFLRLRDQRGLPKTLMEQNQGQMIKHGQVIMSHVLREQKTLLLNVDLLQSVSEDIQFITPTLLPELQHLRGQDLFADDAIISSDVWKWVLITPLVAKERVIGTLGIATRVDHPFVETEVELLKSIGDQIAIAVMNARLYRRSGEVATLEERNRVAREIHDTLAQGFTGILIQLQAAERLSKKYPDKALKSLQEARELAHQSLQEARRSVLNLRPTILEHTTLDKAIAQQVEVFQQDPTMEAKFLLNGYPCGLNPRFSQNLYRIAQEGLTNIKRHAQANQVTVTLSYDPQTVTLSIMDNGVGLDGVTAQPKRSDQGFGLVGIRERVTLMGGQVEFLTPNQGGTEIKVVIPK